MLIQETPLMNDLLEMEFDAKKMKQAPPELIHAWSYRIVRKPEIINKKYRSSFQISSKEIRKNSRILHQGLNQHTLFKKLPNDLCIEIAALTGIHGMKMARQIATDNFERPRHFKL